MQAIIPEIVYALWCAFWAYVNYVQIEKVNEQVRHGFNGIFHMATVIYFSIAIHVIVGFALLFIGRLFFDIPLNVFRMGWRNIGYVPRYPKSIVDKVEKWVFGKDGITPKVIYLVLLIALIVIQIQIL